MKRDCLREYVNEIWYRIIPLNRILSGEFTDIELIKDFARYYAHDGIEKLYNDMCNELADNLLGATYESKKEIVNNYYADLHPLMTGYYNRLTELADRVRGLGLDESVVDDVIKVAEAVNDNTIRLGDVDSLVERYYTPKGLPTINDTKWERQVFERAIKRGYMIREGNGYKWLKKRVMLAYMVEQVYCPKNTENVPEKAVNDLFGVPRISNHIRRMHDAKNSQKWIEPMDRDLFSVEN